MNLNELGRKISNTLMDIIEDVVRKHEDRTALGEFELVICKRLMANRYDNNEFVPLIDLIINNLDVYEDVVLRGAYIDDHLYDNLFDLYETYLAMVVSKNRGLDKLSDKEYYWCMDQLETPVAKFISEGGSSNRRRGRDRQYSDGRDRHNPPARTYSNDRYSQQEPEPSRQYAPARGGYSTPSRSQEDHRRAVNEDDAYRHSGRLRQSAKEEVQEPVTTTRPSGWSQWDSGHDEVPHKENVTPEPKRTGYVNTTGIEGPNHMGLDPYGDFWLNGKHYQLAYKSKWKLSGTGPDSFPWLTNIYTEILYFVKDVNEVVTQEIAPVTNENRYLNQQLFVDPSNAMDASYWGQRIKNKTPVNNLDTGEPDENIDEIVDDKVTLGDLVKVLDPDVLANSSHPVLCDNLDIAILETSSKLNPSTSAVAKAYQVRDTIEFENADQADFIKQLVLQPTISGVAEMLKNNPTTIPPAPMKRVTSKIANYIVDTTVHKFGMPLTQMKFPEHWDRLMEWLLEKNSQAWVMDYIKYMNSKIGSLLATTNMIDEDGLPLSAFDDVVTQFNKDRVVAFTEHVGIIAIDKVVDNLSIGKQLDLHPTISISPLTNAKEANILHTRLRAMNSCNKNEPIVKYLVATRDGRLIQIRPSDEINGHLLLNLIAIK